MSVSTIGALSGLSGTTYNFTNVTNAQFLQEVKSLYEKGLLSGDQASLLSCDACGGDSLPIDGQPSSVSQALSDPTTHDFISVFQLQDNWMHANPGSVGTALYDSIVRALQAYQGNQVGGSSNSVSTEA